MRTLLILEALAFLPVWRWYLLRLQDGSDEPWGLLPLATALVVAALYWRRHRAEFTPRGARLSLVMTALYAVSFSFAPPLLRAMFAISALGALFEPRHGGARVPFCYWCLLALSLPIVSTLQFYLGYPLRRVTSELVVLLLSDLPLRVDGIVLFLGERPLLIDAPCSGIKMLWTALYFSCTLGAVFGIRGWRGWLQLSLTSLVVFVGNLARTALLVPIEFELVKLPPMAHELTGVVVLLSVLLILGAIARKLAVAEEPVGCVVERLSVRPVSPIALFVLIAAAAGPLMRGEDTIAATKGLLPESSWPTHFNAIPLQQQPLDLNEQRFIESFPGEVRKYAAGGSELIVRALSVATRKLHPAADCLRAVGYVVKPAKAEQTGTGAIRGCVEAVGANGSFRVCEHIEDARGATFSDVSSWYWSAVMGSSVGPWISTVSLVPLA